MIEISVRFPAVNAAGIGPLTSKEIFLAQVDDPALVGLLFVILLFDMSKEIRMITAGRHRGKRTTGIEEHRVPTFARPYDGLRGSREQALA
jgi:hypothetical protein